MPDPHSSGITETWAGHRLYVAAGIAALGGLVFGYDLAVIAGAILFIGEEFSLSLNSREVVVASSLFGGMLGAAMGGKLADRWGRRASFLAVAGLGILGPLAAAWAPSVFWLILGRVLSGACFGLATIVAPLYIAEIALPSCRGRLISAYTLAVMVGVLASYLVDYAFATRHQWRLMLAAGALPAAMLGTGVLVLPESPRWLLLKGLHEKARQELGRIRQPAEVIAELQMLVGTVNQRLGKWGDLFSPFLRIVLIIGIGLAITRQVTGLSIAIFYAPAIFASAGFHSARVDILATVAVGAILVLATLVAMYLVDHWGRRTLLLGGLMGMAVSMGLLGLAFVELFAAWRGVLAVGGLMLFAATWVMGPGTIVFLLIAEIFPLFVKGLAMSLVTAILWGAYMVDTLTFLNILELLGPRGAFWLHGLMSLVAFWFVLRLVPETKGCTLEEIEVHWRQGKHPRDLRRGA